MNISKRTHWPVIPVLAIVISFSTNAYAQDLRVLAAELGLTPESVIVADVYTQAATFLARLDVAESERQTLTLRRQAVYEKVQQIATLQLQLEADPDNATLQNDLASVRTQLVTLRSQVESSLDGLRSIVFDGVNQDTLNVFDSWMDAVHNQAPDEFGAIDLSDGQWKAIRQALRAENRALRRGRSLDDRHADVLGAVRANFDVIAAKQRLNANLANVSLIFDEYAG